MAAPNPDPFRNFDPIAQFRNTLRAGPPWESIVDFATHKSFCGKPLYPRQLTLLKLIYLETDSMTQYDFDVIEGWREGFQDYTNPIGVQPDIWDRVNYLKRHGYTHFPHVQMVMGRRASKGILGGIIITERMAYLYSLGNWQQHYNQVPGQVAEVTIVANSLTQAVTRQFRDVRNTVINCEYLKHHIVGDKYTEFYIQTPGDLDEISEMHSQGMKTEREIATLYCKAASSVSTSGRGGTGLVNAYDEMAHMISGTGSTKTGEEIYCLDPATRVLCSDLTWTPIGNLEPGDRLVGYDEYQDQAGHRGRRRLREATVIRTQRQHGRAFRITFADGTSVICSPNHRWLRVNYIEKQCSHNGPRWTAIEPLHEPTKRTTRPLRVGDHIKFLVEPWETDDTHLGGWLAGMLDGEGHLCADAVSRRIGITQNSGKTLDTVQEALKSFGFEFYIHAKRTYEKTGNTCWTLEINRLEQCLRLLGQFRPVRLLPKQKSLWEGRTISNAQNVKTIVSIEEIPAQDLVDIETTTKTFIAEGLVSHNSAFQPSLDQFGGDALTFIASSPYTKIGQFYELYQEGRVTLDEYNAREGRPETRSFAERAESQDIDSDDLDTLAVAEPTYLIAQLPSWELYRDWDKARTIPMRPNRTRHFPPWKKPVQWAPLAEGQADERVQFRRKQRNPEKFKVERGAQFASVQDAYLNEVMVDRMFAVPGWREPLADQDRGKFSILYRAHADPSRTNANFAFAIGHVEDAPADEYGQVWPHVIIDKLHVWKPENYKDHIVDYVKIGQELEAFLTRFPSIKTMTYDQFNSAGFIAAQRRKFPNIRVAEKTFTLKENQDRFERFKSALNLGWVHCFRDTYGEDGQSLLELELKFLQEINGKVDKPDIGPVQTKDLADAVMVVTVDLLHDSLDRWYKALNRTAVGSTYSAGLKSGREQERLAIHEAAGERGHAAPMFADPMTHYYAMEAQRAERKSMRAERNRATLETNKLERGRRNAFGGRDAYTPNRTRGGRD